MKSSAIAAAGAALSPRLDAADAASGLKGRINHSVCRWCFSGIELEALCIASKEMGLQSIELLGPEDFPMLQKHGLICAMVTAPSVPRPDGKEIGVINRAFNRTEHHDLLVAAYEPRIKQVADAGLVNIIGFSGDREGMSDEEGLENCVIGLKRLAPICEKYGVTLNIEMLNSRVDHPDYMCDLSSWGVELVKRVGSERVKLLYDIYHAQIMEGDIISTIRAHSDCFGHYHTGGVPGRHEIDDSQEINYPAVMRAIVETGYKGHVAQEFIPARPDALASLRQGVEICDV